MTFRGAALSTGDISQIQQLIDDEPGLSRQEIARECCKRFGWQQPGGAFAIRACRALLLRLHRTGRIDLPEPVRRRARPGVGLANRSVEFVFGPRPGWQARVRPGALLVVRPIVEQERAGWRAHMERFHYLGDRALVGESLRYVALLDEELVALLGWCTATLHNGPRERYLGWDVATKRARLHEVVNNARFLILPWIQQRNLASRILAANLRRLSQDWQAVYGHPVLLAETFVDTSRFHGTCYRASNWLPLGPTKGWSKSGSDYSFNGQPKTVFVYPLQRRAPQRLCAAPMAATPSSEGMMMKLDVDKLAIEGKGGLFEVLARVTDQRKARGIRHHLQSILAMAICATLGGARNIASIADWAADQSKKTLIVLGCRRGKAPSERTFRRVLKSVDVREIDDKTGSWVARQLVLWRQALAIDGKTVRGSRDGDHKAVHLLSAVVHGEGLVVAQTRVPGKTNEIKCVEPLFENLDIAGTVVTADALLTQQDIARHLVKEKKADYVFVAKDNQPTLRQDIEALGLESFPPSVHHGGQGPRPDRDAPDLDEHRAQRLPGLPPR